MLTREQLEVEKLRLETEKLACEGRKLRLEERELARPQWRRASLLIPVTAAVIASVTAVSTSTWKLEKAEYLELRATARRDALDSASRSYEQRIGAFRRQEAQLNGRITELRRDVAVAVAGERRALTQGSGALSTEPARDRPDTSGPRGGVPTAPPATRQDAVAGLFASSPGARGRAYDVLIRRYANDQALVPALIAYAETRRSQQADRAVVNGIYNTLVVLSHLSDDELRPHAPAVRAFANSVRNLGPKIGDRVDVLLSRLPT